MSSEGERLSILKKKEKLPSTNERASPVASASNAFRSNRKIAFHRKKSIKEFLVGEDVDTIWGNSYEVSTDGTPSSVLEDATLANSTNRCIADEHNKENQTVNQNDHNYNNITNTSWDLSITIADDEKRNIRSNTSVALSETLNMTERLLVEPCVAPHVPAKVKLSLNGLHVDDSEVQAMDISPMKANTVPSPRKLIYTFPKQAMFVEINDVPDVNQDKEKIKDTSLSAPQREKQERESIRPSWRTGASETGSQTGLGGISYVSETWNSHPHAMFQQGSLAHTRVSGDLANVSSDVDTTIALTNVMTKVLQSRSNESIQKATNMELDESTTTLPTNALARARPSFLPSNQRTDDDSLNVRHRTPVKQELLPSTGGCEDSNSVDISSPMEGLAQRDSLSLDNFSILTDLKQTEEQEQTPTKLETLQQQQLERDKSSAKEKCEEAAMDFGLSSLSMHLRLSSPEMPVVVKPRILRPTLPLSLLENAKVPTVTKKSDTKDENDHLRSIKHTPGMASVRQHNTNGEDERETEVVCKKSLVPMDISTRRHTNKPTLATIHSRMTVDMVESPKQSQNNRGTVFHSLDIDIDRVELQRPNSERQRHRGTVLYDDAMELTAHVPPSSNAARHTNYVPEPIQDDTAHPAETIAEKRKRGTVYGTTPIDESTDCSPHSPQTALNNYRKTVYTLEKMKEDVSVVPVGEDPGRKTIFCNESMVMEVCARTPNVKSGSESSMSCVVYGRNVDELSIHARNGNNDVEMKYARPTTFQLEPCDESARVVSSRQTVILEEKMILSDGTTKNRTHAANAFEEDGGSEGPHSRKSIYKPDEMDISLVTETNAKALTDEPKKDRYTTHATEVMDETNVEQLSCERMEAIEHMEVHKTLPEANNTNVIRSHQQSRIPRLTTHLREDMQDIQQAAAVVSKPRYSTYEREDMDVTRLDCGTAPNADNPDEYKNNSTIHHPTNQQKSRFSIYEHEAMNATNVCEAEPVESQRFYTDHKRELDQNECRSVSVGDTHSKSVRAAMTDIEIERPATQHGTRERTHRRETQNGCASLANEMQHDVTNYNTFLEHHETSHGTHVHGSTITQQTNHLQEKGFNSTRLSKAFEQDNISKSAVPSRISSYRVEAMDETNIVEQASPSNDMLRVNMSENKTTASDHRVDSPMHMSPVASICRKSTQRHNSRQSSYYPEEMERTQIEKTKVATERSTCIESSGLRKADLQRIARQSDPIDMEGISVLENDSTDSKLDKHVTGTTQATNYLPDSNPAAADRNIMNSVVETKHKQPKALPKNRLSCYNAAPMVEETVPINTFALGKPSSLDLMVDRYERTSTERKSNDYMEETIVPESIMVERDVKYGTYQLRISNTVDKSPTVCLAEHPPMIEQHRSMHGRGTVYGTEDTMELTTAAVINTVQEKRNRQTLHQPTNMDLTMIGRDTVTPPPASVRREMLSQRGTIFNVRAMEETPPYGGFTSVGDTNAQKNVKSSSLSEPQHRSVIAERPKRRPRQTILIPQDMDVEDEEKEEQPGDEQSSLLPRETIEDRVPRSASLLPKRTFFQQAPSDDVYSEFAKPDLEMYRQSSQTINRKTVNRAESSAFHAQEISDISLAGTTMDPEVAPCIGNITGMMSIREITEPLALASFQEQSNSVSVICRTDGRECGSPFEKEQENLHDATTDVQSLAFIPTRQNGTSDDEFYDAEGDEAAEQELLVDPLSLTKSRHLTMKFIDVGHLEQTAYNTTVPAPGPVTASKRVHAQVLGSPVINRPMEGPDQDPLQMTHVRQTLHTNMEHTPQGPIKKRPRTSCAKPEELADTAKEQTPIRETPSDDIEEVFIKEERQTLTTAGRASQTLINDPSVFMLEEQNLLDDESDLPCASLSEEFEPDSEEQTSNNNSSTPPSSTSRPPVCMITELSYYKNFANLTIDTLDSYDEGRTPSPDDVDDEVAPQVDAPKADNLVVECISVSDEDSLLVTPPKVPLSFACKDGNRQTGEVLDSTIASNIMHQLRQEHPIVKHPCCGMQTECLCQLQTELKRHQEMSDMVWNRWCTKFDAIKRRVPKVSHTEQRDGEKPRVMFEEQIEELNWRLIRGQVDDDFLFVKGELSWEDLSRRRSRTIISGHYPETPSAVFLAKNFRSYLSEQLYVDNSPPPGAPMPRIPRITQLIANKLSTDTGTRWLVDSSEDGDGVLLLRHRTLRSFVISIQLQPPRSKTLTDRTITENWRLERIQVRECMEEYVHSPKLLLAHIEFMRVATETTEQTLRSTYRTVADLMGLWHHFHELIQRVFVMVNRLVAIIRNNEALLCYDAQMERFYVKKCVHRAVDDEVNTLLVHFNSIGSIGASGVNFKWPKVELNKLLPVTASTNQHTIAPGNFMQTVGSNENAGLMFLECLLWNVAKHYET
uniref:Uncharacterized protein n=1 Tax=Anopheles culicifacies TaxID=139723 RepID=A0A182MN38_9DIPT